MSSFIPPTAPRAPEGLDLGRGVATVAVAVLTVLGAVLLAVVA